MEQLYISGTRHTPEINFDPEAGILHISGISLMRNTDMFYEPVINWMHGYLRRPATKTIFRFDLHYFDINSSKKLLYIVMQANKLFDAGRSVEVEWYYDEEDQDMKDVGSDFEFMVKVPFRFTQHAAPLEVAHQ